MSGSLGWSTAVHFRHLLPRNVFCSKGFRAVLLAGIGVVAAWSTAVGQLAPAREDLKPEFGWHGHNLVGNWTEVRIPIHADTPGEYTVQVTAPDPDGHRVTFQTPAHLAAGKQTVRGYFRVGQLEPTAVELSVHEAASGKSVWSWKSTRRAADQGTAPLHSGYRLVATVGELPGFDWGDSTPQENQTASTELETLRPIAVTIEELPLEPRAYDSIAMLVIAGRSVLSTEQSAALRDWIASGGKVSISLPADLNSAAEVLRPFENWLPATLGKDPVTVSELGKIESFAGKNVRIPLTGRMRVPSLRITQGEVLAGNREDAVMVRAPYGLGSVTLLSLDITQPPLSKWTELKAFTRRLAEATSDAGAAAASPNRSLQLSSTGITDLATQLHAVQENFPSVNRASPWLVMGLLLAILLVVGPIDYLIVHRVLKWPRGTWLTLPAWVILAGGGAALLATRWNGSSMRVNQLNLVNLDVGSSTCHQKLWTNVYSPATERHTVAVQSAVSSPPGNSNSTTQSSWSGIAENAYGGMLRRAGVNAGSADYRAGPVIENLPLLQWSSKPLLTEVHSPVDGLVDANLKSNGIGQLSGTITHRLGGPIEDWFLAYGNRVYRHMKKRDDTETIPLRPRQVLRLDQPNVHPRELRAFLVGKVATTRVLKGEVGTRITDQFSTYDQMSRDPYEITRILTFHEEAGGTKFTELTNRLLEDEDLSHLLSLGRAILFGQLNSPLAVVRVDDAVIPAERETTIIRIILPVTKIGSDVSREIERFDKAP